MTKKNSATSYTPTIHIEWSQVATSLIIGAILGGIALLRFSDSQTIVVASHTQQILEIKEQLMPRSEAEANFKRLETRFEDQQKLLERIDSKLD